VVALTVEYAKEESTMSNQNQQTGLDAERFQTGDPTADKTGRSPAASPSIDLPDQDDATTEPPERSFEWGDPTEVPDQPLTIIPNAESFTLRSVLAHRGERKVSANTFGYVVEGVEQYLAENESRQVDLPGSYSAFEDQEDDLPAHWVSASVSTARGGLAILPARMETAIRLATGGGRYSADDITFHVVKGAPAVIEAPEGVFVVPAQSRPSMGSPPMDDPVHVAEAAGMEVYNEMNETILAGVEALAETLETHFGFGLSEHVDHSSGAHYFAPDDRYDGDRDRLRVSASSLRTLAGMETGEAVVGEHDARTTGPAPDTFTLSEADRDEAVDPIGSEDSSFGPVVGYDLDFERTGGRYSRVRRRRIRLKQVHLEVREADGKSYAEASAGTHFGEVVFEHQRKNESYPGHTKA
jgi:hypothetical protein